MFYDELEPDDLKEEEGGSTHDLRNLLERKRQKREPSSSRSRKCAVVREPGGKEGPGPPDCMIAQGEIPKELVQETQIQPEEELIKINLGAKLGSQKLVFISSQLTTQEKEQLVALLQKYTDVFAWTYDEMPGLGLDLESVVHSLNVDPGVKLVVQPARVFHTDVEAQITQEVKKLLAAGFVKPIQHPKWLSNIVLVKKKNGQIRCCVDFRNLNKACPKNEFPLPNINLLVDSAAGSSMFSFMDRYSGYNQIRMATKDAEKTAFRTPIGNFYYTVMPFVLKNAGATYQRTMTSIFHYIMHKEMEDYVDDIVVKSKTRTGHLQVLEQVFERYRKYKLRMNPMKCAFGVSTRKFPGFLVHHRGISLDPAKAMAIATIKRPTTCDIGIKTPKAVKSQAIADLLAQFPGNKESPLNEEIPREVAAIELPGKKWKMRFDGSATATSNRLGIVLSYEDRDTLPLSFKLDLSCSNNTAEYEAYLTGLTIALSIGVKGDFALREQSLVAYRTWAQRLEQEFQTFSVEYTQKSENRFVDALATLGSQMAVKGKNTLIRVSRQERSIIEVLRRMFPEELEQQDWRKEVKEKIKGSGHEGSIKELKDYTLIEGELYRRLPGGILSRCINEKEGRMRLEELHSQICGVAEKISLYRRMQCMGYYWLNMNKEAATI
ncbi:uncharacterized protein LOC142639781 [Castanea sativa]|uniref:uncharacterized protein LOC142639781 n=1 Tax=Castanea sativa TaxID=21020 RepID=UPI003F65363A